MGLTLTPAFAANMKAVPSAQKLTINGTVVDNIPVYNINGYNYFKLRDIAYYLDYEVEYLQVSNTIAIMRGGHGVNAGISKGKAIGTVYGVASNQRVFIDTTDYSSQLHPVNIGGNNYFQLRELAQCAVYGVQFDAASNSILVNSDYNYSKDGLTSKKADGWKETLAASLAADKENMKQKATEAAKTPINQQQEQKPAAVESVSLGQARFIIETGETAQISASVKPDNAVDKTLTYTSNNPAIATVSTTGLIQGKAGGQANITVTSQNGKTATVYVYVNGYNYDDAKEVYQLVNEEREKRGLATIDYFEEMQPVADIRAKEIVIQRGHDNGAYQFGENLAYGYTSAKDAMYAWVYDDADSNWGHRDTILRTDNRSIVVGCYWNQGSCYWAQLFYTGNENWLYKNGHTSAASQKAREIFAQLKGQQQNPQQQGTMQQQQNPQQQGTTQQQQNPQQGNNNQQIEMERVTLVELNVPREEMVLNRQETFQLEATTYPLTAMPETVSYSSSDNNVVSVTATGLLTAQNSGKATITASTESGVESTVRIIVPENEPRVAQYSGRTLTYPEVAQIVAETFYSDELATSTALEICTAHRLCVEPAVDPGYDYVIPSCQEQNHSKKMTRGDFAWVVYDITKDQGKMLGGGPEYVFAKVLITDMHKDNSLMNYEAACLTYAHGLMDLLGRNGEFKDKSEITEQEVYDVMERLKNKLH